TCVELVKAGYDIVVVDNFVNSCMEAIRRVRKLCGVDFPFEEVDLTDAAATEILFQKYEIDAVMHFAGLKAVGESVKIPVAYYRNNLDSTLSLIEAMLRHNVKNFIFSSSATVYGSDAPVPYNESTPVSRITASPYGNTKLMIEYILKDTVKANPGFNAVLLRYFNPVGAHESGEIGEDPTGIPNTLMPFVAKVAVGKLDMVHIFGNDYDTPDGTCLRDYIHVVDLAKGHVAALKKLDENPGVFVCNLGTGKGTSVLEMVKAFSKSCGRDLPYEFAPRREGDLPAFWADPAFAKEQLGWVAERGIQEMCDDVWRWQSKNPNGYKDA
ncbi:MAG: UDP-glucose 4-epimerase GalE, partial [Oscillibacter sp.]|nr:UDP-glucose 4-epimerase GalE [Oscillibacter sp.]